MHHRNLLTHRMIYGNAFNRNELRIITFLPNTLGCWLCVELYLLVFCFCCDIKSFLMSFFSIAFSQHFTPWKKPDVFHHPLLTLPNPNPPNISPTTRSRHTSQQCFIFVFDYRALDKSFYDTTTRLCCGYVRRSSTRNNFSDALCLLWIAWHETPFPLIFIWFCKLFYIKASLEVETKKHRLAKEYFYHSFSFCCFYYPFVFFVGRNFKSQRRQKSKLSCFPP